MKTKLLLATATCLAITSAAQAQTWERLNFSFENQWMHIKKFYPSPDDNILITGIRNANVKVKVSTDGGNSWQETAIEKPIFSAKFAPNGSVYLVTARKLPNQNIYATDTLYRSTDGLNWNNLGYRLQSGDEDYHFAISGNNTLYFPNHPNTTAGGVFLSKSTDNGASWTITAGVKDPTAVSHTGDTIIQSYMSPWPGGVKYSHDGGATFQEANMNGNNPGGSIPVILPNGHVYTAAIGTIYRSTDGGMSFNAVNLHQDVNNIRDFKYGKNGKFYIQVMNGIWETANFQDVTAITATLPNWQQFYDMELSDNYVYALTDTSIYRTPLTGGPSSASEHISAKDINVFPNPASNMLHVQVPGNIEVQKLVLTDQLGRAVLTENGGAKTLHLHNLTPGIYLLTVTTGSQTHIRKVLVQ